MSAEDAGRRARGLPEGDDPATGAGAGPERGAKARPAGSRAAQGGGAAAVRGAAGAGAGRAGKGTGSSGSAGKGKAGGLGTGAGKGPGSGARPGRGGAGAGRPPARAAAAALPRPAAPADPDRPRGASARWGSLPFPLRRPQSRHGQVTAVSMMKDEGPYVIEWVAHHLALGFTDLVVYTNDCSDGTDDMLIRLEELGLCHHRRNVIPEGLRPQPSALNHAQEEPVVQQSDWVMVFDADEFLSIRHGDGSLEGLLDAVVARGANGIVVTWRVFGSGGILGWSRTPVTEQFLCAAPPSWNKGWGVKTLFRHDPDKWKLGIHRPKMKSRWVKTSFPDEVRWLNGSGREMEDYFKFRGWRSIARTVGYDWVQLNHYAVKSVEAYAIRKLRGNVNFKKDKYNADYWALMDRNEVRDETMLRYSDRRNAVIAQLLADPVLGRLHTAAVERVETRLAELRGTEAYARLVAELAEASRRPIHEIAAKPPQPRDPAKIAAKMSEVERLRGARAQAARRAEGAPARPALPEPIYVAAPSLQGDAPGLRWVANQGVLLPLDPRVFAPPALAAIEAGKFQRGLARRLPGLVARGAVYLEIGAGAGFIPAHLAAQRPDLRILMQEEEPALAALLVQVMAENGRPFTGRFRLLPDPLGPDPAAGAARLVAGLGAGPVALALGDPRLGGAAIGGMLAALPAAARPRQLFLTGRLHAALAAEGGQEALAPRLAAAGYAPDPALDPALGLAFRATQAAAAAPEPPPAPAAPAAGPARPNDPA